MSSEPLKIVERALALSREPLLNARDVRIRSVSQSCFDASYLEFLDEQIRLGPRGPEWTARLRRRREALASYCDKRLLYATVSADGAEYSLRIDPETERIVHWERLDSNDAG
jgi:hypothetical protein